MEIRSDLFERANKILYKSEIFRSLNLDYETNFLLLTKMPIESEKDINDMNFRFEKILESKIKVNELFSEFATVMQLSLVFFGPKTTEAFKKLNEQEKWWESEPKLINDVIDAMKAEFSLGLL